MRGEDPQLCRSRRLDTSCERRVIVRNFLLKYMEFSHMARFRCMKAFGWVGILLLGVFVTRVASAAPAITPDSGPIGIAVTITGEGFGKFVSTRYNAVLFGKNKAPGLVEQWRDTRIEVKVPSNAITGPLVVRVASMDPLPDGSCCAPVQYSTTAPVTFTVMIPITLEPTEGPVGSPVVISGRGFGQRKPGQDAVLFNGVPAPILQWTNTQIRVMFPLNGASGPVTLKRGNESRVVGMFRLTPHRVIGLTPDTAPVGALVTISGENFGVFYEGGPNQVLFGGVPGRIFQWTDRVIDVWVPISANSGPLVVRRGAGTAKPDGSCCAERGFASVEAGLFTLAVPKVASIAPETAEIGSLITIKGSGFGEFIKSDERTQDNLSREGHQHLFTQFGVNIARSAVLFPANKEFVKASHVAGYVENWTDTEIKVRVPQVAVPGKVLITRGSWDMLPDGTCCKDKEWMQFEAGRFTPTGLDKITADYLKNIPNLGSEQ